MLITSNISRLRRWPKPQIVLGLQNYCKDSEDSEIKKKNEKEEEIKRKLEAKQRMQDLLQSLTKGSFPTTEAVKLSRPKLPEKKSKFDTTGIEYSLKEAAKNVAETLEGDPEQTKSELLKAVETMTARREDLSNVLSSMKVTPKEQPRPTPDFGFPQPKSRLHDFRGDMFSIRQTQVRLFDSPPLGIFPADFKASEGSKESVLMTWDIAWSREKTMTVTRQPTNYFEEMIRWTDQGKLWHFPIDNETGMKEEKSYSFADHIFLERHMNGWCPPRGPIRLFMELVCIGLSKNHHISVPRKVAHIEWFRDFFESRKELLKDIGAI